MTNVIGNCDDTTGDQILSNVGFDVVAVRRDAGAARRVVLPYFTAVVQGGTQVVSKRVGYVALDFPAGSLRAQARGQAVARVSRSAASLPAEVRSVLNRRRRAGEAEAAIDPLSDPTVRAAVARATFEHLVGFQLTQDQLRYNATR
jgi:F420-0:gamma-glutamyl ligase-like protein